MARTAVNAKVGVTNSDGIITLSALTAGATGTAGYMSIGQSKSDKFALVVENTGSATGSIWIKASNTYIEKDLGDLAVVVGGSVTHLVGPLESQRFAQSGYTGEVNIDSGITGTIFAIQL